jgi:presenilin-like A22 family membrane protease
LIRIVSNKGIIEIIVLFCIVLFLGFAVSYAALTTAKVSVISSSLNTPQFTDFAYLLDAMVLGTLLLIVLRRHHSKTTFFRFLEFIIVAFTSFFFFLVLYAVILPQHLGYILSLPDHVVYVLSIPSQINIGSDYILAAASALMLILVKEFHPRTKDLATMVSSIGIGLLLGISFSFLYAMIILAIVALYDYITIFLTKAIVRFDKALIAMDISFLISVSDLQAVKPGTFSKKEEESYEQYLIRSHKADEPHFKKIIKEGRLPVISQISLGEGDLSLPLMASISAFYSSVSLPFTAMVMFGAMVGVTVTMLLLKKFKKPLPAIPAFFGFISVAAGIGYLFTGQTFGYWQPPVFMAIGIAILALTVRYLLKEEEQDKKEYGSRPAKRKRSRRATP